MISISVISFCLCAAVVVYVIAFYPALLAIVARKWRRPVRRASNFPSVSIIVAVNDGAQFIARKLDSICALDYPQESIQVIVVNDGSADETGEIARAHACSPEVIDIAKSGKALALNHGVQAAKGEILVLTDVRQQLAPDSLRLLMENLADPAVGAASAELQIRRGQNSEQVSIGAYWMYERWIRLKLSALDSIFGATGSYYAIRRELAVPIPAGTLLDDMYLPLNAFFKGYRLVVDSRAHMYDYPTDLRSEFGRKVRTLAGNYQILRAYPQLLGPKNRMWIHFVSYKFARLLLPFALVGAAVSAICAGGGLEWFGIAGLFLGLFGAFMDEFVPEGMLLKRITSPLRTFVVMMLATVCAMSIWFVPPERLWRPTRVVRKNQPA